VKIVVFYIILLRQRPVWINFLKQYNIRYLMVLTLPDKGLGIGESGAWKNIIPEITEMPKRRTNGALNAVRLTIAK
jgi:hypothetical protein